MRKTVKQTDPLFQPTHPPLPLPGPFCHRVLLAAGEKAVPHTLGYIDFAAKPAWLLEVNPAGSVPVAKGEKRGKAGVRKRTTRKAPTHTAAPPLSCPHSSLISPSPFPHTDLASGDWVVDSGVICDWLEDKWPTPALGKTADAPAA